MQSNRYADLFLQRLLETPRETNYTTQTVSRSGLEAARGAPAAVGSQEEGEEEMGEGEGRKKGGGNPKGRRKKKKQQQQQQQQQEAAAAADAAAEGGAGGGEEGKTEL
jgi:hypothetical protein